MVIELNLICLKASNEPFIFSDFSVISNKVSLNTIFTCMAMQIKLVVLVSISLSLFDQIHVKSEILQRVSMVNTFKD